MATKMEIHVAYVEEMNEALKLDPPISTEADSVKELKKLIKKEMAMYDGQLFVFDQEKVSEELWEFLTDDLDIEPRPKKEWASFLKVMEKAEQEKEQGEETDTETETETELKGKDEDITDKKTEKKKAGTDGKTKGKEKAKATDKTQEGGLTMKQAKAAVRKLMESGKKMTRDEIAEKLDITSKKAGDALSFLKNEKYADGPVLNIVKDDKGRFSLADGKGDKEKNKSKSGSGKNKD